MRTWNMLPAIGEHDPPPGHPEHHHPPHHHGHHPPPPDSTWGPGPKAPPHQRTDANIKHVSHQVEEFAHHTKAEFDGLKSELEQIKAILAEIASREQVNHR
jgi:hypothetical protein